MIEILESFPDDVVAFCAKGRVTRRDYDHVLAPKVREAFSRHKAVRCYYELGAAFSGMEAGAAWEDFKVAFGHYFGWTRVAVVTDTKWIRRAMTAFQFLVPGEMRVFGTQQVDKARKWIVAT